MMLGNLYAYTGGKAFDAAKPCVVFIHGAQHDHSVWILQSRWFAHHGYGVLAFDLPGHGRSTGKPCASVEEAATALWHGIDAAGVTDAHLIGHSMGSLIALQMAADAPQRVKSLSLLGTAYPMKVSDALLAATRDDVPAAIDMINVWSHSGAFGGFSHKPQAPGPGFMHIWSNKRLMQRVAAVNGAHVLHNDFVACNAYANGEAAAKAVRCPVLVINGEQDAMTPLKAAKAVAAMLPGSKLAALPNCGHALAAEQPDAVLKHLAAHIAPSP
jgi:pimeloyl-ACP methyl ester carboxylesterase